MNITTHTVLRPPIVSGCAAFLALLLAVELLAQDQPKTKSQAALESSAPGQITLEIKEGALILDAQKQEAPTLGGAIKFLRGKFPENIVLAPGLAELPIEELKLRTDDLRQVLEALRVASGWKFEVELSGNPPSVDPVTGLPAKAEPSLPMYVLRRPKAPAEGPRRVEVFNLSAYLERRAKADSKDSREAIEEIQNIVRETLIDVFEDPKAGGTSFKFHPGTQLLVAIGSPEALEVARQVVDALTDSPHWRSLNTGFPSPAMSPEMLKRYGLMPPNVTGESESVDRYGRPQRPKPSNGSTGTVPPADKPPGYGTKF